MTDSLLNKLLEADVICRDCGLKYGKYSVGCSSVWQGDCDVCGEHKGVTEVRDYGYLSKGIAEERARLGKREEVKKQSKKVADYMLSVGPIMNDEALDGIMLASYEQGEITCKFTEDEIGFLNECLDTIQEFHPSLQPCEADPIDVALFESVVEKITALYDDHCVKYELSPAMKAYHEKYNEFPGREDDAKWEGFRDAYNLLNGGAS